MNWCARYEGLNNSDKGEFIRVVNLLLSLTFVNKKHPDQRRDYYFIERHEELFCQYLALAGWELRHDAVHGVYQAINSQDLNRLRLKLEESIMLLLIRLIYEEKRKELHLSEHVSFRVRELQEKYAALKISKRPINKKALREGLALFKRFHLLEILDGDVTDPECRLLIYPAILLAVRVEDVRQVYERLSAYGDNGEEGEAE